MDAISASSASLKHNSVALMDQLFVNDLMALFHFTDAHTAPISTNSASNTSTDTQVKDFNQIVNYRHKSLDL
jgi:hypothetical protein